MLHHGCVGRRGERGRIPASPRQRLCCRPVQHFQAHNFVPEAFELENGIYGIVWPSLSNVQSTVRLPLLIIEELDWRAGFCVSVTLG